MSGILSNPRQRLNAWVAQQIASGRASFPADATLAQRFGLSRKTVEKVMRVFAGQGSIVRIRGKGTFSAAALTPQPIPETSGAVDPSRQLAEDIKQLIRGGAYKSGTTLPSVKYFAYQYHVSRSTVIRAYRQLRGEQAITKIGRLFYTGSFDQNTMPSMQREVFLLVNDEVDFGRIFHSEVFSSEVYRHVEQYLADAGYMLRFGLQSDLDNLARAWQRSGKPPHGLILYNLDEQRASRVAELAPGMARLKRLKKFPVIWDWAYGNNPLLQADHFVYDHRDVSRAIAKRVAALVQRKEFAGVSITVHNDGIFEFPSRLWELVNLLRLYPELWQVAPHAGITVVMQKTERRFSGLKGVRADFRAAMIETMRNYGVADPEDVLTRVREVDDVSACVIRPDKPHLWVCHKDSHCAAILRAAQRNRIAVPKEIAIVGLECNPQYFPQSISRCEADWEGIGYLLAHAIIGDFRIPRDQRRCVSTRARLIEKTTT